MARLISQEYFTILLRTKETAIIPIRAIAKAVTIGMIKATTICGVACERFIKIGTRRIKSASPDELALSSILCSIKPSS
jgi:DNA-binding protein